MNNRGFTLIELLAAIAIIAVLGGIAVVGYQNIFANSESQYYSNLERNLLLAGSDYFQDHRSELPTGSKVSQVSLTDLVNGKYINPVLDSKGKECKDGSVYAYRENGKYKYDVCLVDCNGYYSDGKYCSTTNPNDKKISLNGRGANSSSYYNLDKSYNSQIYSKGENVVVSFSMGDNYTVSKYVINNTTLDTRMECLVSSGNTCEKEIDKSGSYEVISYNGINKISTNYFSVKIAKGNPNFRLETEPHYRISGTGCTDETTKKVTINIVKQSNEEYKSIKYQINGGEMKEPNGYTIEEELESGHYVFDVIVKNYSSDEEKYASVAINVSYFVDLVYDAYYNSSFPLQHEVVKGQNYDFIEPLPILTDNDDRNLSWYKNGVLLYPTYIVGENCPFTLSNYYSIF